MEGARARDKDATSGVAGFFENVGESEVENSKKSNDAAGSEKTGPPGLESAPSPAKMLSVEELESGNEVAVVQSTPEGSVGPPPSTEPLKSTRSIVSGAAPPPSTNVPPSAPSRPPHQNAHPSGGGHGGNNNSGPSAGGPRGKKHTNRNKNNGIVGMQQGTTTYPAMMQYGMYGQDPNSMLYAMNGAYGNPNMMQLQPGQVGGHPSGGLNGVMDGSGAGASSGSGSVNNPGGMGVDAAGIHSSGSLSVGANAVAAGNIPAQQQAIQYQTQSAIMQSYGGMNAGFPHPPQQMGSGYATAYQMGGMYGAPAGWTSGYPNQFAHVGYGQNPNAGGRGPGGMSNYGQHSGNSSGGGMQGYGGVDPTQGYGYGMAGNLDYNSFGVQHTSGSSGMGKGGHKSKGGANNRSNSHNHEHNGPSVAEGLGADGSPAGSGNFGGSDSRANGSGSSQDVRASNVRGANNGSGIPSQGSSAGSGHLSDGGSANMQNNAATGGNGNSGNGSGNRWNSNGQDMLWAQAQQQMQYQQQMAMMNGQYQQQATYQQNGGYGNSANWR